MLRRTIENDVKEQTDLIHLQHHKQLFHIKMMHVSTLKIGSQNIRMPMILNVKISFLFFLQPDLQLQKLRESQEPRAKHKLSRG